MFNVLTYGNKLYPWLFRIKCCGPFFSNWLELKESKLTVKKDNFGVLALTCDTRVSYRPNQGYKIAVLALCWYNEFVFCI